MGPNYSYYFEQIINDLEDIQDNQETIIQNQEQIISGDNYALKQNEVIMNNTGLLCVALVCGFIYAFIKRCMT